MLNLLRETRKKKRYTMKDMTIFLGFKAIGTYSKKERGEIPITINEAKQISDILKCSPMIFFK